MDTVHEDCFVVFVRSQRNPTETPETVEQEVGNCGTYEEARRIRAAHQVQVGDCVIRYVGDSGGGD